MTVFVRMFGGFELRRGAEAMPPLASARAASLLGYLLLHRHEPVRRERVAFTLWPDSTEAQARTNLRHLVHEVRRSLPGLDDLLDIGPRTLGWRASVSIQLDVAAFEESLAYPATGDDAEVEALTRSLDLYRGDLLEGCYDEWVLGERERLRQRSGEALERLIQLLTKRGAYTHAIRHAEQLLRRDPLREDTYRTLLRLHDARGDRASALRVYHTCAATLERELGVEPSEATRHVYDSLLTAHPSAAGSDALHAAETLPLVGRIPEWTRLTEAWLASHRGRAQLVTVSGEAGIGKTRLVEDLRSWCAHRGADVAEARAYAAEGVLPYEPIAAWLRADGLRARVARLDRGRLRVLKRLLPEIDSDPPPGNLVDEAEQRHQLFEAVARTILTPGSATLLVADDLQWFDRETLQCMHYLLRADAQARLLIAGTMRTGDVNPSHPLNEFLAAIRALGRCVELDLGRLTTEDTANLAEHFGADLEPAEATRLHEETEGNPLFVIEALRAGWRGQTRGADWTTPKVQGVIESRLAQLSAPARDLLTIAAAIGREFTTEVLARASGAGDEALVPALDELWQRRLVRERSTNAYDFSHDKIREVVYLNTGIARRRHDHQRIARALEATTGHDPGASAGIVASHYDRAGMVEEAIAWYERAGEAAQRLHANAEAVLMLDRALELLRSCPDDAARDAHELALLTSVTTLVGTVEGYASGRLADLHARALAVAAARRVELPPPLLRSLAIFNLSRGDFQAARPAGAEMRARAARDGDDMLRVEAEYILGITAFWKGELDDARRHFEEAIGGYRVEDRLTHVHRYGQDAKVTCLSRLGNTLWLLGRPGEAVVASDAALAMADETGHPHSRGLALIFASMLSVDARDERRLRLCGAALADSAVKEHATIQIRVAADAVSGYIDVLDRRVEPGIVSIRRALEDLRGVEHAPGMHALIVRLLLEACAVAHRARSGLEVADRFLGSSGAVRVWEAEVRRLRATFLAALGAPPADVTGEIGRARRLARQQGARAYELRICATNLQYCQERRDQAAARAARVQLSAVIHAYPAGTESAELRDATSLL